MTPVPAKVLAVEKTGDRYQVVVRIETTYRGSFNTLAFGENKPFTGSWAHLHRELVCAPAFLSGAFGSVVAYTSYCPLSDSIASEF
jgi:hypothetical protein